MKNDIANKGLNLPQPHMQVMKRGEPVLTEARTELQASRGGPASSQPREGVSGRRSRLKQGLGGGEQRGQCGWSGGGMVRKEAVGGQVVARPGGQVRTGLYFTEWDGKAMEGLSRDR